MSGQKIIEGLVEAIDMAKLMKENERLRAALTRLEQIYNADRVAADQANEIETIFDKHLHSSVSEPAAPGDED